jgi:hypothetical protein
LCFIIVCLHPSGAQGTRLSTFTVEAKDCIRS